MAGVAIGPGDVHTRAAAHMNFHAGGLAALVDGNRHGKKFSVISPSDLSRNMLPVVLDCREGMSLDGPGKSRCAGRAPA